MYKILAKLPFKSNHVYYLPSCHSTNEAAQKMLLAGANEGTTVITDDQFAGKGQSGNKWFSEPGQNLTFSLILKPTALNPNDQFLITAVLSLAIQELLEEQLSEEVAIKWPNDIYIKGRKIAGLLIENTLRGNIIESCVAGIGLNVNQSTFSQGIRATSMTLLSNTEYNLNGILNKLLEKIAANYAKIKTPAGLMERYQKSLLGRGQTRKFKSKGVTFEGEIIGTDSYGRLLVRKHDTLLTFLHKEIEMIF